MVIMAHVLAMIGIALGGFASIWLAVRFGLTYRDNKPGVYDRPGRFWETVRVTTMEGAQRVIYGLLGIGFLFLLVAEILRYLAE
jgi:hypothetical protein